MSAPRVTVIIPTYQRRESVRRALEALGRQTIAPSEYEVIVVIDGSSDGTRELLAAWSGPVRVEAVWQPNAGRACARNAGIARATGELVVFLDDDMEPVPDFLAAHLGAHPPGARRAVVGPVPIPEEPGEAAIVAYRREGMHALLDRLGGPGYRLGFRDIYTGNLSVRRDVLDEVGAFDTMFTVYGHEDYEIGLRLAKAGVDLAYCASALAYQRYEKDFPGMARDCIARGETAVLFARKHPEAAGGTRLAGYHDASWKWRLVRSSLLWLSELWPRVPERLMTLITRLERRRPARLHKYYTLAVDFFFWYGARTAVAREAGLNSGRLAMSAALRITTGLLVLFALVSAARLVLRAVNQPRGGVDEITAYEARFRELQGTLPARARLGYLSDTLSSRGSDGADPGRLAFKRYLLAQYALLPAILRSEPDGELVLGNFDSLADTRRRAPQGFQVVRDLGNGVLLLRRSRP
jgi:glycosyltransferase involved in cell wall biosynthesis